MASVLQIKWRSLTENNRLKDLENKNPCQYWKNINNSRFFFSIHTVDMLTYCSLSTLCAWNRHCISALLFGHSLTHLHFLSLSLSHMLAQLESAFCISRCAIIVGVRQRWRLFEKVWYFSFWHFFCHVKLTLAFPMYILELKLSEWYQCASSHFYNGITTKDAISYSSQNR